MHFLILQYLSGLWCSDTLVLVLDLVNISVQCPFLSFLLSLCFNALQLGLFPQVKQNSLLRCDHLFSHGTTFSRPSSNILVLATENIHTASHPPPVRVQFRIAYALGYGYALNFFFFFAFHISIGLLFIDILCNIREVTTMGHGFYRDFRDAVNLPRCHDNLPLSSHTLMRSKVLIVTVERSFPWVSFTHL